MARKFYRWTVEIQVEASWVADGFDLDDDRMHTIMTEHLSHAYGHEVKAKVIARPNPLLIAVEQGATTHPTDDADYVEVRTTECKLGELELCSDSNVLNGAGRVVEEPWIPHDE